MVTNTMAVTKSATVCWRLPCLVHLAGCEGPSMNQFGQFGPVPGNVIQQRHGCAIMHTVHGNYPGEARTQCTC